MTKVQHNSWTNGNEDLFFGLCLFYINKKGLSVSNAIKAVRKLEDFKHRSFHSLRSKYYDMKRHITEENELGNYLDLGIQYMYTNYQYSSKVQLVEVKKTIQSKNVILRIINKIKRLFK